MLMTRGHLIPQILLDNAGPVASTVPGVILQMIFFLTPQDLILWKFLFATSRLHTCLWGPGDKLTKCDLITEVAEFALCSEGKCQEGVITLPSMCDLQDLGGVRFLKASICFWM